MTRRSTARPAPLPSPRLRHAALAALVPAALVAAVAPVLMSPASANTDGTALVLREVYGAGGNGGATYNADFVELYNPTAAPVGLAGLGLQYRSSSGGSGGVVALAGTVPAGKAWLVRMSTASGTNGAALPTPDQIASPAISMSATSGQVLLLANTTPFTGGGDLAGNASVIDMVGYGPGSGSYETSPTTANLSATTSANRTLDGADTDDNSADFANAAPTPTNSGSTSTSTPTTTTTTPTATATTTAPTGTVAIAAIQGTGATSPLVGSTVTTEGVVTGRYATGGLNGLYIQTDGTGGTADATPGASDAIFVYGTAATAAIVAVGDPVRVTGVVSEFEGTTEITASSGGVTKLGGTPVGVTPLVAAYPTTDAGREAHEGELLAPTDDFVVTNNYTTNQYGTIGLASGGRQLRQPTDVADAQDTAEIAEVVADNDARGVILDDASTWNYLTTYKNTAMPWITTGNPVRTTSRVSFTGPVILEYRNDAWTFQPQRQVTDNGSWVATFSDTRTPNTSPEDVGGDLKLATFNVLNYFNTVVTDWSGSGKSCSTYKDRNGDPVTANSCTGGPIGIGPRGAAESTDGGSDLTQPDADLERQQAKIVKALNVLNADVVSLEEIENSVALGESRDDALSALVTAANAAAGTPRWAYVPSPSASDLPLLEEQDVIRTAFIYNPSKVALVGGSKVLLGSAAFGNAREPLAQAFKQIGLPDSEAFSVIVNHFKSKGSGTDDGTGQGNSNPSRVAQAGALRDFAASFAAERGTDRVFLTGDFNAYTMEDPMQVLEAAGYTNLASDDPADTSYQFGGMAGSLDHILANDDALGSVNAVDVWQVNAEESVGFEYSRFNYNATLLFQNNVFRASDHNPEVVGIFGAEGTTPTPTDPTTTPTDTATVTPTDTPTTPTPTDPTSTTATPTTSVTPTTSGTTAPSPSSLSVTAADTTVQVGKDSVVLAVKASTAGGPADGAVAAYVDGKQVSNSAVLTGGAAALVIDPFATIGTKHVEVRYAGNVTTQPATASVAVTVKKQRITSKVAVKKAPLAKPGAKVTVVWRLKAINTAVAGKVSVKVDGKKLKVGVKKGKATIRLGAISPGTYKVRLRYLGGPTTKPLRKAVTVTVKG